MKSNVVLALACAAGLTVACRASDTPPDRDLSPSVSSSETFGTSAVGTSGATSGVTTAQAGVDTVSHGSDSDARNFALQASKHGAAEVELAKLAGQKAVSREVKEFASMMVRDHTKGGNELKQAVAAYGAKLSSELPDESEKLMEKLSKLSGAEFDREYMKAMVDGHQEMRGMTTGRLNDAKRMTLSKSELELAVDAWAEKVLPTVEAHLAKAQSISDALKRTANDTR